LTFLITFILTNLNQQQTSRNINLSSDIDHKTHEKPSLEKTKNIISLGLHAVAKKIKIPVISLVEVNIIDNTFALQYITNQRLISNHQAMKSVRRNGLTIFA